MPDVTAYFFAPSGSLDIGAGVAHLQNEGWSLTSKMYRLRASADHPAALLDCQIPKAWKRFAETEECTGVQGRILRNGVDVCFYSFSTNGVSTAGMCWKSADAPDAIDDTLLLPLADSTQAWLVVILDEDPWWLPSLIRVSQGVLGFELSAEQRMSVRDDPPQRVYVHQSKTRHVNAVELNPDLRRSTWVPCELGL